MRDSTKINADVLFEYGQQFGVFANAFRVVEETGGDCFLDFMEYSATEKKVRVVARVRVRREFLEAIGTKLGDAMALFGSLGDDSTDDFCWKPVKDLH